MIFRDREELKMAKSNNLPTDVVHIGSRLELFVDDWLIERLSGAERRLQHPVPQAAALDESRPGLE